MGNGRTAVSRGVQGGTVPAPASRNRRGAAAGPPVVAVAVPPLGLQRRQVHGVLRHGALQQRLREVGARGRGRVRRAQHLSPQRKNNGVDTRQTNKPPRTRNAIAPTPCKVEAKCS